jgi:hypothetical protein
MELNYNNVTIPLVLSYENDLSNNQNAQLFKKRLEEYNWEYKFIGEGMKWNGFRDRVIGYYNFLIDNLPDDKIVVLSDSRDVFCVKTSNCFIQQIKEIVENKIIISSEMFLIGHMNWNEQQISNAISKDAGFFWQGVPLNEYWEYHQTNPIPFRKYLNSGLIVGKSKNLKIALKWIIDNNFNDDQLGFCNYTNKFPYLVHLDYEANILHTSTSFVNGSFYDYTIQKLDSPTLHELLGFSSYFLHIPGINGSKGQKYIYDIIYTLFNNNIITSKNIFDIYGIKEEYPIRDNYFIKN